MLDAWFLAPVAALLFGVLALAPLGAQVLARGVVFIDLAVAQAAAAAALWVGAFVDHPAWITTQALAVAGALACAGAVARLSRRWPGQREALIGLLYVLGASIALLGARQDPHGRERMTELLAADVLWAQWPQVAVLAASAAVVLTLRARLARDGFFYAVFATVTSLAVPVLGLFLVFAALIAPALWQRAGTAAPLAWAGGAAACALGVAASWVLDAPSGACVVLALAAFGLLSAARGGTTARDRRAREPVRQPGTARQPPCQDLATPAGPRRARNSGADAYAVACCPAADRRVARRRQLGRVRALGQRGDACRHGRESRAKEARARQAELREEPMSKADELRTKLIRNWNEIALEPFERMPLYQSRFGSLTDGTVARQLGAGFDIVPPGRQSCPYHFHHAQEEMFVILEGEGALRVAGERVPVRAGDVITIPAGPEYPHHLLNTGSVDLKYLSISTMQRPEVCEYPDSGKIGTYPADRGRRFMAQRAGDADQGLDYWLGEP